MKKFLVVGAIALAGLGLTGCGGASPGGPYKARGSYLSTNDGRVVYCLSVGHGLSCDWANAE